MMIGRWVLIGAAAMLCGCASTNPPAQTATASVQNAVYVPGETPVRQVAATADGQKAATMAPMRFYWFLGGR